MKLQSRINKLYKKANETLMGDRRCFLCYMDDENNRVVVDNPELQFAGTREEFEELSNQKKYKNDIFVFVHHGMYKGVWYTP